MPLVRPAADLTRDAARLIVAAAQRQAETDRLLMAVACVDRGGHLILLERMDGAATCAAPLALSKAETAAATEALRRRGSKAPSRGSPTGG